MKLEDRTDKGDKSTKQAAANHLQGRVVTDVGRVEAIEYCPKH